MLPRKIVRGKKSGSPRIKNSTRALPFSPRITLRSLELGDGEDSLEFVRPFDRSELLELGLGDGDESLEVTSNFSFCELLERNLAKNFELLKIDASDFKLIIFIDRNPYCFEVVTLRKEWSKSGGFPR